MREIHKTLRVGAIVCLAWFAAAALTPLTSVAIRNSTIDSSPVGSSAPSTGRFNTLGVVSNFGTSVGTTQGQYFAFNTAAGTGESDFINQRGAGPGGFNWYNATNTGAIGSPLMTLAPSGVLTTSAGFTTTGGLVAPTASIGTDFGNLSGNVTGNVTGNLSGTVTGNLVGNASTATALAANPSDCPTGQAASGINAAGVPTCVYVAHTGNGSNCTTGGSSFSTCTSTVTWETPFPDNNYRFSCTIVTPSDPRAAISGISSKSAATANVTMTTLGSVAISFSGLDCIAQHN